MTTTRLNEAVFGVSEPRALVFRPINETEPARREAKLVRDRSSFDRDEAYRSHLAHELEAAQIRGDTATAQAARDALEEFRP